MSTVETNELDARIERIARRVARSNAWLTAEEAAKRGRMSKGHFLRQCRSGAGPASSGEGRLTRFRAFDVDAWIEGGCNG